jgi:GNAT superfamily N-acetyltransferase
MIHIRKATPNDMQAVHQLIYELAVYEKEGDQVENTPEQMKKDGFGERPLFEIFVAEHEGEGIVGIAMFYFCYSSWKGKLCYLDDLVVTEHYRRSGVGKMLFNTLAAYALEQDARQLRWHVMDWNEPAIKFYEKIEAELDPTWITCRLSRRQLEKWEE